MPPQQTPWPGRFTGQEREHAQAMPPQRAPWPGHPGTARPGGEGVWPGHPGAARPGVGRLPSSFPGGVVGGGEAQLTFEESLIRYFKTRRCDAFDFSLHDHRSCPFFHSSRESDRRRVVLQDGCWEPLYSADPCVEKFDSLRPCSLGDSCGFCHSTAELLYHPDVFRKRLCHQGQQCPRGRFCAFAHTRRELLVPHFEIAEEENPSEDFIVYHFKTQWCPIGGPHGWEACVYAHTYRDWRRSPIVGYSSRPCPNWSRSVAEGPAELGYDARCPRGMSCPLAHGSKEQLYHPRFYKTNPCSEKRCARAVFCAFHHGNTDARRGTSLAVPSSNGRRGPSDRLVGAEELLAVHQPMYLRPPKYHALEDPVRAAAGGGAFSSGSGPRGRSRPGSERPYLMPAPAWEWDAQEQAHASLPAHAGNGALGAGTAQFSEQHMPEAFVPYFCQWMPFAAEGWGQDGYPAMLWDSAAGAFVPAMGQGPWLMEAAAGMHGEAAEQVEGSAEGSVDVELLPSVLALDGALRRAEGLELQGGGGVGHGPKTGVRTPSWSPPQSATPTELPSPRPAELTAGSSGCSGDASDEVLAAPRGA